MLVYSIFEELCALKEKNAERSNPNEPKVLADFTFVDLANDCILEGASLLSSKATRHSPGVKSLMTNVIFRMKEQGLNLEQVRRHIDENPKGWPQKWLLGVLSGKAVIDGKIDAGILLKSGRSCAARIQVIPISHL